jgi:hypothetical protein
MTDDLFACNCDEEGKETCAGYVREATKLMKGTWAKDIPAFFVTRAIHELGGVQIHEDQWCGITTLGDPHMFVQCDRIEDGLALAVIEKHRRIG